MVPVARVVEVKQAWPEASSATVWLSPPGPVKVTVPVGVPDPGALVATTAQTETVCPHTEGLGNALTVVVVPAGLTVTPTVSMEPSKQGLSPL